MMMSVCIVYCQCDGVYCLHECVVYTGKVWSIVRIYIVLIVLWQASHQTERWLCVHYMIFEEFENHNNNIHHDVMCVANSGCAMMCV